MYVLAYIKKNIRRWLDGKAIGYTRRQVNFFCHLVV